MYRAVDEHRLNDYLKDKALRLAEDGFDERIGALVTEAGGDRTRLAEAAACLSMNGAHREAKRQIAFALLMAAAHCPTPDQPRLKLVNHEERQ